MAFTFYLKRIFLLLLTLSCSVLASAQKTHNMSPNSDCRFVKKTGRFNLENMSGCIPCREQRDKDLVAVKAEVKKREQARQAESAALLKQKMALMEEDMRKRNEAKKAAIEAQSKNVVSFGVAETKPTPKPSAPLVKPKNKAGNEPLYSLRTPEYLGDYVSTTVLLNSKGDTVFNVAGSAFKYVWAANKSNPNGFPAGYSIAYFDKDGYQMLGSDRYSLFFPRDLLNAKSERIFNDDNIQAVNHLVDDFFFVGYGPTYFSRSFGTIQFGRAGIYNVRNKSFFEFEKVAGRDFCEVTVDASDCSKISHHVQRCKELTSQGFAAFVFTRTAYSESSDTYILYVIGKDGNIEKKSFTKPR